MESPIKETPGDRKCTGAPGSPYRGAGDGGPSHAGGRTRRYSVGMLSSRKSFGEGHILPKYLRASTGSCHDFCKYGRKQEQLESRSPKLSERPAIVGKEKFTKTVRTTTVTKLKPYQDHKLRAPAEVIEVGKRESSLPSKKVVLKHSSLSRVVTENQLKMAQKCSASYVKPKPVIMNPSSIPIASARSNGERKKEDIRTVKTMGTKPQAAAIKSVMAKATPTVSVSSEPSVSRVISLKAKDGRILKPVSPLEDQNWMPRSALKQSIASEVQENVFDVVEAESEDRRETIQMEFVPPTFEIVQDPPSLSNGLIIPRASESSSSSSHKEVLQEGPSITSPIYKSSQYSSDNVVLDEFEYADHEQVQSSCEEVSEEGPEYTDDKEAFAFETDSEIETSERIQNKIPRKGEMVVSEGKHDEAVTLKFMRGKIYDLQPKNNGPRRLKFRRGRVMDGNEHRQTIARTYEKKDIDEATNDSNHGSGSVVLKHQVMEGKKEAQGLFNNVIEETASKLVESRKSKVKALVGAFETVISLQDVKPPPPPPS